MNPAITVIIPTYNRAALVPLAINSVLSQTLPAAEIIVVDDGSPDNTLHVLKQFGTRIRVIRQPNSGVSTARNTGISAARTEWITFLDDDDLYAPDRLQIATESIRRFPGARIHASNMGIVVHDQPLVDLFELRGLHATEHMTLPSPLIWALKGCYYVQSLVVHRETLLATGCFRHMLFEDLDLVVRLTQHAPWIVDRRHSVRLMRRDGDTPNLSNDWRSKPVERSEALIKIHRETLTRLELTDAEIQQVRTGLGTYLFELGSAHCLGGQKTAGRENFLEAARAFPALHSRLKARAAAIGGRQVLNLLDVLARRRRGVVR